MRAASSLPFIFTVTTSGIIAGGDGWSGGGKNGGSWHGVVGGADEGVSGGGAESTRLIVALSRAKNDSAATGAKSFCRSAYADARFAESVSTS